jgi:DNA-directed RNA polymerase specialized sigma24 family protein
MANDEQNKLSDSATSEKSTTSFPRTTIVTPPEIEVLLKPYAQYLSRRVRKHITRNHILTGELDEEIKDISQTSLIKFWLKLTSEEVHINAPKSYMNRIAFSQCIDVARLTKRKPIPMSENQDGKLAKGDVMIFPSEGMGDPANEYERKESISEIIDEVMQLPPKQQYVMICVLKDEVAHIFPLTDMFRKHGIEIMPITWPRDSKELQRLRSLLSVARRTLREKFNRPIGNI